mgnify:FL=1
MHYRIYIDVVFFTNLLIDYILIRFTGILFKCGKSRRRALLGAVTGALFSCGIIYLRLYLGSEIFLPALILLHGGCAAGMLVLGCDLKKGSLLLKAILTLYFAAFLCGGFWEVIVSNDLTVKVFLIFAAATWFGSTALLYLIDSLKIRTKNIYPVTIYYKGKGYSFYGFYDSGNLLMDPVNGKPVSVGTIKALSEICSEETVNCLKNLKENPGELKSAEVVGLHPHYIVFHSIGEEQGMMLAVTLESLCIQTSTEVVCVDSPVFAFSFEASAFGKEYEILLNSRLL